MKVFRSLALLSLLLLVAACQMATPYQRLAAGDRFGYTETRVNDHTYTVSFSGNSNTTSAMVWYYWVYRCAELTEEQGYDMFAMVAPPSPSSAPPPHQQNPSIKDLYKLHPASVDGQDGARMADDAPASFVKVAGTDNDPFASHWGGYVVVTDWTAHGTMAMYRSPLPKSVPGALNARVITAALKAYVESKGHAKAPSQKELIRQSVVINRKLVI